MAPHQPSTPSKPFNQYKMTAALKNIYYRLTPSSSSTSIPTVNNPAGFTKARSNDALFPPTDPAIDGEDCLHDCASCTIKYPSKFTIDEDEELYGHIKGWSTHLIVATGKTDWVRDVADEKGSVMEAVDRGPVKPSNGRLMLSASNIPVPEHSDTSTTVLLLPSFTFIDNVTPNNVPELISDFINTGPTNTSPLGATSRPSLPPSLPPAEDASADPVSIPQHLRATPSETTTLKARPCPHKYLILLCSQKTRDARCGQSAPLLRRELERHLRPLGLYRDLHDERPGGVGIYFISHVGGHKFSANMMIYRKTTPVRTSGKATEAKMEKLKAEDDNGQEVLLDVNKEVESEAGQCIWLARVRPEDCENIVKYTVLQGKVVKPERQLRGGFDRTKQLVSW
ncbi:hypothetical protein GQ43DRAFT_152090 [Delitschia confertaspora ATCC 74209]|uniref:Sucrase/ferredoxin-like protein n=1 Tax=Delitschia confertaspora ATCC 74209 TaxID=1513339 RepID=A0A9P4JSU1_9PLEO|nr:hypothetical protein GQ43DRAFT_152090 [Delitschia confertaspora ATCC 74209]